MNVRQAINVAELDVDSFIDQIEDPTEAEVQEMFASAADKGPNQDGPGSPGFILSGRATNRVAGSRLRLHGVHRSPQSLTKTLKRSTPGIATSVTARLSSPTKRTRLPKTCPLQLTNQAIRPPLEQLQIQTPIRQPTSQRQRKTKKSNLLKRKILLKQAKKRPAKNNQRRRNQNQLQKNQPQKNQPQRNQPQKNQPQKNQLQRNQPQRNQPQKNQLQKNQLQKNQPQKNQPQKNQPQKNQPQKNQPQRNQPQKNRRQKAPKAATTDSFPSTTQMLPRDSAASSEAKPTADKTATVSDEPQIEDEGTIASGPEEPATAAPAPLVIPSETEEANDENPAIELEFEYRELDDDLREEIREELLQTRVRTAIDTKMAEGWEYLRTLQTELSVTRDEFMQQDRQQFLDDPDAAAVALRNNMAQETPNCLKKMKAYADENGFTYAVTPLVSYQDFMSEDDYPLGVASDPNQSQFQASGTAEAIAYKIYSRFNMNIAANDTQLFIPERGVYEPLSDDGTESHYAYWAVEFVESHIPTIEEPGVRDDVVLTLKRIKSRKILTERAELLAQKVRDGLAKSADEQATMAATLESETITGEDGSATLTVQATQPFSWLRQSQTPQTSFQSRPRAEFSTIRFADGVSTLSGVGQEFMKTIFEELSDEEVGIVPSPDRTRYFIVHVTNRFPTKDKGLDGLHDRFVLEGRMNFMRSPVMGLMSNDIVNPTVIEWERTLWRKYGVDPDEQLKNVLAYSQRTDG